MARQDLGEPYYRIDSNEARSIIDSEGSGVVVIDVRRPDEWIMGHVSDAMHIPIDDLVDRIEELPQEKKLLFICAAGVRSGLACEIAASVGFPSEILYNIEDGTPAWIELGHPTDYDG